MHIPVKYLAKYLLRRDYRHNHQEIKRLKSLPRYVPTQTNLLGQKLQLVDAASFLSAYHEIFQNEIYRFKAKTGSPTIIDCGANIGLSVLYFKSQYPQAQITAFEPDPDIFNALKMNMENNGIIDNVKLINKAVWSSKISINFAADGADGGRIFKDDVKENIIKVPSVRLKDYLSDPVDFLKIDIEGAETEVILDCDDALMNVENLFVEYHSFSTKPQTVDKILSVLTDNGFRYHIHPELTRPKPFISHKTDADMDMRLNIFAYQK